MNMSQLYEKDFYQWTIETANALKEKAFDKLDIEHLQEEIESMGISQERELESRLEILMMHLLKWQYQPNLTGKSWKFTIKEQRRKIKRRLAKTPSLKHQLDEILHDSYGDALLGACKETGLEENTFPDLLPYTLNQLLDDNFFPNQ